MYTSSVHYSTAKSAILRHNGVPCQVTGFSTQKKNEEFSKITDFIEGFKRQNLHFKKLNVALPVSCHCSAGRELTEADKSLL